MTNEELKTLQTLLNKLKEERLDEYRKNNYDVDTMDIFDLFELDDGDNLLEGIDIVSGVVEERLTD